MSKAVIVLFLLVAAALSAPITVHVIPHSHCDAGWLKTYDDYFNTEVTYILSSVTDLLFRDQTLKFVWVEQIFFQKWWKTVATQDQQTKFRTILKRGQIEFLNGGWVMHDDATTTYTAMIDQTTLGHQFIADVFGEEYLPRVGWTIDPFGLSSVTPKINKEFKEEYHMIVRVSYERKYERIQNRSLEFLWRYDPVHNDADHEIFTHITYEHYGSIGGFNWDYGDAAVTDSNIEQLADKFVETVTRYAKSYLTDHILFPLGNDFQYQNANINFSNMTKIINYVNNKYPDIKVKYSKATDYFDAVAPKAQPTVTYPTFVGDFFPYADNIASFWTGYFVSRAEIKDEVRRMEFFSHVADQLFAQARMAGVNVNFTDNYQNLYQLRFANGLVQHHDAVTGTEKPDVEANYFQWLAGGLQSAAKVASNSLLALLAKSPVSASKFKLLPSAMLSYLTSLKAGDHVPLIYYNALGWSRNSITRVLVNVANVEVRNDEGQPVASQVTPNGANYWVTFTVTIPALGIRTYTLTAKQGEKQVEPSKATDVVSNSVYDLSFQDGKINKLKNKRDNLEIDFNPQFLEWESYAGPGQSSGAYIFRSAGPEAVPLTYTPNPQHYDGDVFHEVRQVISPYLSQTTRLYHNDDSKFGDSSVIDFSFHVGAIPQNRELVVRFNTNIQNGRKVKTDNNGLHVLNREYRDFPNMPKSHLFPTASNFYPFVYHASIEDDNQVLTIITNTTRNVAALKDGSIEVMLQRRCAQDDGRGVGVPLNVTTPTTINIRLVLTKKGEEVRSGLAHRANYPLESFGVEKQVDATDFNQLFNVAHDGVSMSLPDDVHLLTLQQQSTHGKELTMVRVANVNQFGNTSPELHLDSWFEHATVHDYTETALDGLRNVGKESNAWNVQLQPLQIRTFLAQFDKK